MCRILPGAVLLAGFLLCGPALAGPFDVSPYRYGPLVNKALSQAGSEVRFHRIRCMERSRVECRFSSERIAVLVEGQASPPRTSRVSIEADLMQDKAGAGPLQMVADSVLPLGATMAVLDPALAATRRVQLLSDLMTEVLDTGRSEDEGAGARYTLVFDEAASGVLAVTVTPLNSGSGDDLAHLDAHGFRTAEHRHWSHP